MRASLLIAIVLLTACTDSEKANRRAAESACYRAELDSYRADMKGIAGRYKIAKAGKNSVVDIVIERQRRIERFCMVSAKCYGSTDPALSNLFEWCLDDERE